MALFLAAFLLFQVQPMLGKALLPQFGGAPSTWTVCLLFFQSILLCGYAYAHFTRPRIHMVLLGFSLLSMPIALSETAGSATWGPASSILILLTVSAGLPYFVLSSTSPLLQRWSQLENPYRLYALSNAASLLALVSYPFLIEPWLSVGNQFKTWSGLYVVFVINCAVVSWHQMETRHETQPSGPVSWRIWGFWILLSATGSALLAATTNQMCQEVAPIPFLWIGPMLIYLASFILTFEKPAFYQRNLFFLFASLLIPSASVVLAMGGKAPIWIHVLVDLCTLFVCLIILHGELADSKPGRAGLTRFYLALSIGGAAGGAFVALVAPQLFQTYAEFPLALAIAGLIAVVRCYQSISVSFNSMSLIQRSSLVGLTVAIIAPLATFDFGKPKDFQVTLRNFYGVLKISNYSLQRPVRLMTHGRTTHGMQFLEPQLSNEPSTYYSRLTGVGMTLRSLQDAGPVKVGIAGLGVGTLAAYGRPGDHFRFYELNPQVIAAAHEYFTFLKQSKAKVEIAEGDARISLSNEQAGNFDALIIDAFSSDSIPIHLLTAECGIVYRKHLKPGGRLIIHISNRTLNLEPVVRGLARYLGMNALRLENNGNDSVGMYPSTWMVLSGTPKYVPEQQPMVLWHDDFASLWPLVRR